MKEQLVEYIKACQEAFDASKANETHVSLDMGRMSLHLNLNGQGDLIKELIQEFQGKYSVVKFFGTIVEPAK